MNRQIIDKILEDLHFEMDIHERKQIEADLDALECVSRRFSTMDTKDVEPMVTCFEGNWKNLREDIPIKPVASTDLLKNTKSKKDNFVVVSKVVK